MTAGLICPTCGSPECTDIDCGRTDDEADEARDREREERLFELERENERFMGEDRRT